VGALLGFDEESLFPDFDGFAQAHSVEKAFAADATARSAGV
jgi:hypothetical protein